jgi:hypothetical protein
VPNWCQCYLTVTGSRARVEEFWAFARGEETPFDFNRFIPYPEEYARADRKRLAWERDPGPKPWWRPPRDGYNAGGYEWCVANWGTKWNAQRVRLGRPRHSGESVAVTVAFVTAWNPPKPVVVRAADRFPDLDFRLRYFERGVGFCGTFHCAPGAAPAECTRKYAGTKGG